MANYDYDVIVAGGGGAGLTAAYRLGSAGYSVLVIDKEDRFGGRTLSGMAGNAYPYNLGTQYLVGDDGPLADLRREIGIAGRCTANSPLGLFMHGKLAESRSNFEMLRKLPISLPAKISLAFHILKLQSQGYKLYNPNWIEKNPKKMFELDRRTYGDLLRGVHPEALPFFRLLASDLCGNNPEDISSIGGVASTIALAHGYCFVGDEGNDVFHKMLLEKSGADAVNGAEIIAMRNQSDRAEVAYIKNGVETTVAARYIVSALPSYAVAKTVVSLPLGKQAALEKLVYGAVVAGIFITSEEFAAAWRKFPTMVSFDTTFALMVNQSFPFYGEGKGRPGSVISALAFTDQAKALLDKDDDEIRRIYKRDILKIFPDMEPFIMQIMIKKWPHALPGYRPGAYAERALRNQPFGRIHFSGDYTAQVNSSLRTAVISGEECAQEVLRELQNV
jgi:monoamine oxidase